jgi:endonuclease G
MIKTILTSLFIAVFFSTAHAGQIDEQCPEFVFHGTPVSSYDETQQLCKTNWAVHYLLPIKASEFVVEKIDQEDVTGSAVRRNDFRADTQVSAEYRAELSDYVGEGYDRGHLSPAAANTNSVEIMSESFLLTNMVPQVPNLNRGIWLRLELRVRNWVRDHNKDIYAVSGAVYNEGFLSIGNGVAVPTHMFKVVVDSANNKGIAFYFPNDLGLKIPQRDLPQYAMSIRDVEKLTGINFHPLLPANLEHIETDFNIELWPGL